MRALSGLKVEFQGEIGTVPVIVEDIDTRLDNAKKHVEAHRPFPVIVVSNVGIQEDMTREEAGTDKEYTEDPDAETASVQVGTADTYLRRPFIGGVCSWDGESALSETVDLPVTIPKTRLEVIGNNRPFNIKYTISTFGLYENLENQVILHIFKQLLDRTKPLLVYDSWSTDRNSPDPAPSAVLLGHFDLYPEDPDGGGVGSFRSLDMVEGGFKRKEIDLILEAVLDLPHDPTKVYSVLTRTFEIFEVGVSDAWETYQPDQVIT